MSTLTRDTATRRAPTPSQGRSQWNWPDPVEGMPPTVSAGTPPDAELPIAARWPVEMPARAWPPLPEPEVEQQPAAAASPRPTPVEPQLPPAVATVAAMDWAEIPAQPVSPARTPNRARDPSPSRLAYRMNRLWLTPTVRHFVRVGLPLLLMAGLAGGWLAREDNRAALGGVVDQAQDWIKQQPMFQVTAIDVQSRSPEVAEGVARILGVTFPVSTWDLDLAHLRQTAEALDAVERAWLQVRSGGVLEVRIEERVPVMIWRNGVGLDLVDATGHRVARLATRAARPDLPLIAGEGAPDEIAEARLLWAAAGPLHPRLRGLVRVGQRRWDMVLDRGQRILLPAEGALGALERVVALDSAQQLLSRDVVAVDMRNPARPTLRLTADAMSELTRNRTMQTGAVN
ncbi:MAG TPA: cell division protein FtsQ/DivIB [Pararhodobacter sp.]|uniref:cell division protein FtsQ/DivIB n=1 Tax=Pararhodobacter sp. TaxID=2127056 RepID=UPI002C457457|nr:cell division protein FtsQ/DivIB [Pararhodobacter sp.]HPD94023.1 cell division protein FtsQ/DivIB [Pararhodobacter sp.]